MIQGNERADLQIRSVTENDIGTDEVWTTVQTLFGWFDLINGDSKYTSFDEKVQESSHIFLADYKVLDKRIKAESSRAVIAGHVYDIMLIDDPMGKHRQLEFYLKYTGGQ